MIVGLGFREPIGVDRLLWEVTRLYFNRYVCSDFNFIQLDFYDYDSSTASDFLGSATLILQEVDNFINKICTSGTLSK